MQIKTTKRTFTNTRLVGGGYLTIQRRREKQEVLYSLGVDTLTLESNLAISSKAGDVYAL